MPYLVFEYLYRDAGNYKAFGELWLSGSLTETDRAALIGSMDSAEFFIAEQVSVPPLYEDLYKVSGGWTDDDHAWHILVAIGKGETILGGWGPSPQGGQARHVARIDLFSPALNSSREGGRALRSSQPAIVQEHCKNMAGRLTWPDGR